MSKISNSSLHPPPPSLSQVELTALDPKWSGSLRMGLTSLPPQLACQVDRASNLSGSSYVLGAWESSSWLFVGGQVRASPLTAIGGVLCCSSNYGKIHYENLNAYFFLQAKQQLPKSVDLLSLQRGQTVGVACCQDNNSIFFFIDGHIVHTVEASLPQLVYALVDLYGPCCEVKVQPLQKLEPRSLSEVTQQVAPVDIASPGPGLSPSSTHQTLPGSSNTSAKWVNLKIGSRGCAPLVGEVTAEERPQDSVAVELDDSPRPKQPSLLEVGARGGAGGCGYQALCRRFVESLAIPGP